MARNNAQPKTSARRLEIAQRRQQVAQMRMANVPVEQIAASLGIDDTTVYKDIKATLDAALVRAGEELRGMQIMRYEELIKSIWLAAKAGNLKAIDRLLDIMAAENKLIGADAPTKIAPTTPDGLESYEALSPDAVMTMLDQEINSIIQSAKEREGQS